MMRQDEIDKLMAEAQGASGAAFAAAPQSAPSESRLEGLLNEAEQALAAVNPPPHAAAAATAVAPPPPAELPPGVKHFEFRDLVGKPASTEAATLDLLRDVQLDLKIELGRTRMQLEEVLQLKRGAVVTLDKLAGDPVDIFVNGRLIARGEVLVLNDSFCVRVAELVAGETALD
jgi:flagellar motor switch protein FliN/FliY